MTGWPPSEDDTKALDEIRNHKRRTDVGGPARPLPMIVPSPLLRDFRREPFVLRETLAFPPVPVLRFDRPTQAEVAASAIRTLEATVARQATEIKQLRERLGLPT